MISIYVYASGIFNVDWVFASRTLIIPDGQVCNATRINTPFGIPSNNLIPFNEYPFV